MSSITVGVLASQFLDFVFIRMTNEQVGKYNSVRGTLRKIIQEEGKPNLMLNGFGKRFMMLFLYYSMLVLGSGTWKYSYKIKGHQLLLG